MAEEGSADAVGVDSTAEETERGSSIDSFPEVNRDGDGTTADDEPAATDRAADDGTDPTRQSDESTGAEDGRNRGCDHDSAVPCRFQ